MTHSKNVQIAASVLFLLFSGMAYTETNEALTQRNQSLRQQYDRLSEFMLKNQRSPASASSTASIGGKKVAYRSFSGPGTIELSKVPAVNQQLINGMNSARSSLQEIRSQLGNVEILDQQRLVANASLDQAVEAYFECRVEAKMPITAHYEYDPYLKEMIFIKNALTIKDIDTAEIDVMLDRLMAARTVLVTLTGARQ